ncbi:hypothetical protein [Oceanobacillus luteolus]|uniref:Uncharacterized protein n=1 Tax=Oceanobacillus luteolus TaxID=1274358 RepID=A0ABW4HWM7_9BACI
MKISTSYPYPVLFMNNDDYVDSSFHAEIDVKELFGEVVIYVTYHLDNKEMLGLIEEEACTFILHVEYGQTSYRRIFPTTKVNQEIHIPSDKLRGKVELFSFVTANTTIENYTNSNLNDFYKGAPIVFEKGNIMAIGDAIETTLFEDDVDLLNLPSIIKVTQSERSEYMEVDITQDLLIVSLPKYEYEQYIHNRKSVLKQTILSNVFLPSLVQVFSKLDESYDFEDSTWYQVLEKIFAENNIRIEEVGTDSLSALKAAQMVLRKPIKTSFEEIEKESSHREGEA